MKGARPPPDSLRSSRAVGWGELVPTTLPDRVPLPRVDVDRFG